MLLRLTAEEVISIHEVLVADFAKSADPISPPGLRSIHLLESAVSRQFVGFEGGLKYETPVANAATLCYGVCSNHPFHNGNKRTALVSTLCHLDRNGLTISEDVTQDELYKLMLDIAGHRLLNRKVRGNRSDQEVQEISQWFRGHTRHVEKSERVITCHELTTLLHGHGYELENLHGNYIDVVRYRRPWLSLSSNLKRERIMRIPYPRDGAVVGRSVLKELRERCNLTEKDGVDSVVFYSRARPIDYFVNRYRKTLRSLAKV